MEKVKAVEVMFEGSEEIEEFAKSILLLTNMKSNDMGVIGFRTMMNTNKVQAIFTEELYESQKEYFKHMVGEEKMKTPKIIYNIDYDDIDSKIIDDADRQLDKYLEDGGDSEPEPHFLLDGGLIE